MMTEVELTRSHVPCPNQNEEVCKERRRRRTEILRGGIKGNANSVVGDESWRSFSGGFVIGGKSTPHEGVGKCCPPSLEVKNRGWSPRVGGLVRKERGGAFGLFPVVGAVVVAGRQREMEDAVTVKTNLCSPVINGGRPVHFFGVYDGHGGSHFAILCKEKMHTILEEELMRVYYNLSQPTLKGESGSRLTSHTGDGSVVQEAWKRIFTRTFIRTEMVAMKACGCGNEGFHCNCDRTAIFRSGSTAVVVVLTDGHIAVANCGDSRAILFRDGKVVPLSFDHKPHRADEKSRIESCGGHVFYVDTLRVEGILAMTRAIGDRYLKPSVTSEPEVTFTKRNVGDEFVIIASDGLWDVMSNEMACHVTRECLKDPVGPVRESSAEPTSRSEKAANLLTRLAMARNSRDNISVVVVDLKKYT